MEQQGPLNPHAAVLTSDSPPLSEAAQREILAAFMKPRFAQMIAGAPRADGRVTGRRRLWDIEAMFHCPVVGTCICMQELRRLARRANIADVATFSDYELHSVAVSHAVSKTALAEAMQKWLERKYQSDVARTERIVDAIELVRHWREKLANGDVAGAFWALVTHPYASPALIELVYRDVHMLSHQAGAGQCANLRRLREMTEDFEHLRARLAGQQQSHLRKQEELRESLSRTEAERDKARAASSAEAARTAVFANEQSDAARITTLEEQLAQTRSHALELERRLATAQSRCRQLEIESRASREAAAVTDQALRQPGGDDEERGVLPDLAGRELLCVGGRVNLREHYRSLVERCNGRFSYHDGGIEDGALRLHGLLQRADAVICPSDCVGHPAYHEVKRLCKRTGKPCVLLSGSGLGSFSRGLCALNAANDATLISL